MPQAPLTSMNPKDAKIPTKKYQYIDKDEAPTSSTPHPTKKVTEAMKKFTYSFRTTVSPSYILRDKLSITPTKHYPYSDSRTGVPYVKSLPPSNTKIFPPQPTLTVLF